MICRIGYIVPVSVEVDTEEGTIRRVVIEDEEIKLDRDDLTADSKVVVTEDLDTVRDAGTRAMALTIADTIMWPQWEFGW